MRVEPRAGGLEPVAGDEQGEVVERPADPRLRLEPERGRADGQPERPAADLALEAELVQVEPRDRGQVILGERERDAFDPDRRPRRHAGIMRPAAG